MRVTIDATPLLLRSAGVKNYFYFWLKHLRRLAGTDRIRAFPFLGEVGALTHEVSVISPRSTWPRLGILYFVNIPGNPAINWLISQPDVFHVSNQVRNPPRRPRLTATVHDMTCRLMPELHTPANVQADRTHADRVLRCASGLIAVSENTKNDTVRLLGVDPEIVEVIYPGVAEAYFEAAGGDVSGMKKAYGLHRPYLLYVGTIEPRKNLDTLIDAYGELGDLRKEFDLIVIGSAGWSAEKTMQRLRSGEHGVRYLGYVPEDDLPVLMAGAAVFVYPSLYEGFGFPVAQAMACGVPVVVSGVSSLPEVVGDAGLLVDPRSVVELEAALRRLLTDPNLRNELATKGRGRAGRFRWDICAQRSLEFFHRVAGRL